MVDEVFTRQLVSASLSSRYYKARCHDFPGNLQISHAMTRHEKMRAYHLGPDVALIYPVISFIFFSPASRED